MPAYLRDSLTSPRSPSVVSEARVSKLHTRARCVCALSIQRLEGRRWRLRLMRPNGYGNSIFSPICKPGLWLFTLTRRRSLLRFSDQGGLPRPSLTALSGLTRFKLFIRDVARPEDQPGSRARQESK